MGFAEIFCIIGWLVIVFSQVHVQRYFPFLFFFKLQLNCPNVESSVLVKGCLVVRPWKAIRRIWDGPPFLRGNY